VTKLRLLALVTDAFGGHGGIARYNQALIRAMGNSELVRQIVVLPRNGNVEGRPLPAKITQLPSVASRTGYATRSAWTGLAGGPLDLVFCGHLYMCPLAVGVASALRVPLWLQLHGVEAWQRPSLLVRRAAESSTLVTAVSRYTRRRMFDWANIDPARVKVLPNTVDSRFIPGPKPDHLIARHGLAGRKVLLTVSRLAAGERYKGHDRVILALPNVLQRHPDAIYVIAGDGDDRGRLQEMAKTSNVAHAVRFIGRVADRDLPDYFRLADVFVMPSTGEGFGIVYLEAAASGIPVIAGDGDGSPDALADGVLGTLIDPNNPDQLIGAIIAILDRPSRPVSDGARFAFTNFSRHVDEIIRYVGRSSVGSVNC
jgi:phosphatidylinositol alpha-1,6-mannosyltransferase